jgi:signal transduction histidine kinase
MHFAPAKLFGTVSFRLAALYLVLFSVSVTATGAFVYRSVRRAQDAAFDERIVEEVNALQRLFLKRGRAELVKVLNAREEGEGTYHYGLVDATGALLAGRLRSPLSSAGWSESKEVDPDEPDDGPPETVRSLMVPLLDGSKLIIGDELAQAEDATRAIFVAFAGGLLASIVLGLAGGIWLSREFLRRIESMRVAAQRMMDGDWARRIPIAAIDDDLSALGRTFNRLFDRIEKLLLANRHVSADVAHDLRTPLAKTLRDLRRAREGDATAIDSAIVSVEVALETFEALLRIGQIESGGRRAAFKTIDFGALVTSIAEDFRPSAEEQNRSFTTHIDGSMSLRGDFALLAQMIANLLDNAFRHTPPGVGIFIAAEATSDGVRLTVADHGLGVPASERSMLFRRFYRGEAARGTRGTGLGLALVAAIAELHDMECLASDNAPGLRVIIQPAMQRTAT